MPLKNEKGFGPVWLVVLVAAIGIIGVGYFVFQSNTDGSDPTINQETSLEQSEKNSEAKKEDDATETTITTGDSEFGSILFDGEGQAIYIWELEESTTAECYDDCADAWPPVLTNGAPIASGSVNSELLGTTDRNDGTTQVTYNGHPLYYYAHEEAGEVKCHNISTHGGLWWVILSSGVRVDYQNS
jgi:predicted lipoprotein with Yx(FWY)xxD motif